MGFYWGYCLPKKCASLFLLLVYMWGFAPRPTKGGDPLWNPRFFVTASLLLNLGNPAQGVLHRAVLDARQGIVQFLCHRADVAIAHLVAFALIAEAFYR